MRRSRGVVLGAIGAASLALGACTSEGIAMILSLVTGRGEFANFVAAVFVPRYALPGPGKASVLKPAYVVHWGEITAATHTASVYMATVFGESTPLTFGYKMNKKGAAFTADPKAPAPTATAFVKERLEEISPLTFTVTWAKVTGSARVKSSSPTVRTNVVVRYKATVDTGPSAGKRFTGKIMIAGDAGNFASN